MVALLVGSWRSRRSELIKRLCARLAWNSTRVIRIAGSGRRLVDIRCFCDLLVAAVPAGTIASDDPAERLRGVLGGPHAGKRRLTLIVEDADALSVVALAFVMRLAVASSARPRRVQVLLLGSHALQARLAGNAGRLRSAVDEFPTRASIRFRRSGVPGSAACARRHRLPCRRRGAGTLRLAANNRLSAKAGAALEAPPARALPSVVFALGEASSTPAPSGSASMLLDPDLGAIRPGKCGSATRGCRSWCRSGFCIYAAASDRHSGTHPPNRSHSGSPTSGDDANAELLAQLDALLARRSAGGAAASDAEITELLTKLDALLARRPAEDAAPPDVAQSASRPRRSSRHRHRSGSVRPGSSFGRDDNSGCTASRPATGGPAYADRAVGRTGGASGDSRARYGNSGGDRAIRHDRPHRRRQWRQPRPVRQQRRRPCNPARSGRTGGARRQPPRHGNRGSATGTGTGAGGERSSRAGTRRACNPAGTTARAPARQPHRRGDSGGGRAIRHWITGRTGAASGDSRAGHGDSGGECCAVRHRAVGRTGAARGDSRAEHGDGGGGGCCAARHRAAAAAIRGVASRRRRAARARRRVDRPRRRRGGAARLPAGGGARLRASRDSDGKDV